MGSPQGLTLSLTVLGRVKPDELLRRDKATAGDLIYVTGSLGQAAAGLETSAPWLRAVRGGQELPLIQSFLDPRPEVAAGRLLAQHHLATSLIDLSDGVASDLYQICLRSQVGAVVEAGRIPITRACEKSRGINRQRSSGFGPERG